MKLVENQTIVVTGAGSGIGRAVAELLAAEGATVVLGDLDLDAVTATLAAIDGVGSALALDVRSAEAVADFVRSATRQFGRITGAINCAGVPGPRVSVEDTSDGDWDRVTDVNLKGLFYCLREQVGALKRQEGGGAIVNIASSAGLVGYAGMSAYTASKHGVVGLTRAVALDGAGFGIRVNAVCPGATRTPMVEKSLPSGAEGRLAQVSALTPMGRLAEPSEIAEAAVWLCSDRASFVTGQALSVDGGYTAQ